MSIVLRCGFAFLTLLVLYVFFVIFRQLGEVSLVFNEIVQNGIMAYRVNNDEVIGERQTPSDAYKADYVADIGGKNINGHRDRKRHDHRTSSLFKTDNDNLSEFKRAPNAKYTRGQFRNHFHEKIFAVEREIFQSLQKQSARPTDLRFTATRELARERPATSTRRNETSVQASSASFLSQGEQQDALSAPEYPENFPASRGARVMILAYQRSGSSFIGEMFNRNPEVFYLFEPIQPIEIATGQGKFPLLYDTLVAHLLHVVYTCSFDKHPYLVNFLSSSPFRLKSQTLTSSGLCEANVTAEHMHRLCKPVNASILKRLCSSRSHVVIKTIRASSRKLLEFTRTSRAASDSREEEISHSLKVLHLVRDPRAIIASRLTKNLRELSVFRAAANPARLTEKARAIARSVRVASSKLCSRMHSDTKHGEKLLPAGRYALIRYEDAAARPLEAYEEIYEFAGMDRAREAEKWLKENTESDSDPGYYSTSRNSSASARRWRAKLPFALVREIEKQCGELMETLGYIPVEDETGLRDLSKDLVAPWSSSGLLLRKSAMKDNSQAQSLS